MAATLECIGIPNIPVDQVNDFLAQLASSTRELHRSSDVSHSLWRDYSGAAIGIHVQKGKVACITPWFTSPDGPTRWHVESFGPTLDPRCLDCSGADLNLLDDKGEVVSRATIQWLFFRPYRDWLHQKRRYRLEVAAFAERCEIYSTEAEFEKGSREGQWLGDLKLAPNAFLPVGMFGDVNETGMRARARAVFAGRVKSGAVRENSVTGEKFLQLRVETLPGEIDVVHPAAADIRIKRGWIALVSAWIFGRPVDPPPPPKTGFFKRLFKR